MPLLFFAAYRSGRAHRAGQDHSPCTIPDLGIAGWTNPYFTLPYAATNQTFIRFVATQLSKACRKPFV